MAYITFIIVFARILQSTISANKRVSQQRKFPALNLFSRISSCKFRLHRNTKIDRYRAGKRYRASIEVPIFYKPARQSSYRFRQLSLSILSIQGKFQSCQTILI